MYKSMIRVISLNKLNCFLSLLMNNSYQWRIQGRGPGGPAPPLIFSPDLGPKGRKKIFFWRPPPPPPPPYLRVWMTARPPPRLIRSSGSAAAYIQQIYFQPGSQSSEQLFFIINLHGSIINSSLYIVQSE